jgi:hypothetical protein
LSSKCVIVQVFSEDNHSWWALQKFPLQWAHSTFMFFMWSKLKPIMKENTFFSLLLLFAICMFKSTTMLWDFGLHYAIGQFAWSYMIARCKMLVNLFFLLMIMQIPSILTLGAHHQSMGPKSLCDDYFTKL